LKRVDDGSASDNAIGTQQWMEVTEKRACEKASQALREGLEVRAKDDKETCGQDSSTGKSYVGNPKKKIKIASDESSAANLSNSKSDVQSPTAQTNMLLQKLSQLHNSLPPLGERFSLNIDDKGGSLSKINTNAAPPAMCDNDIVGV